VSQQGNYRRPHNYQGELGIVANPPHCPCCGAPLTVSLYQEWEHWEYRGNCFKCNKWWTLKVRFEGQIDDDVLWGEEPAEAEP